MVAQEGDLLAAAKLSVRELVKLGRRHIRVKVVKSRKTPKREPRVVPKLEPDLVPGAEQQGGVPGPRKRKRVDYAKLVGEGEYGERCVGSQPFSGFTDSGRSPKPYPSVLKSLLDQLVAGLSGRTGRCEHMRGSTEAETQG